MVVEATKVTNRWFPAESLGPIRKSLVLNPEFRGIVNEGFCYANVTKRSIVFLRFVERELAERRNEVHKLFLKGLYSYSVSFPFKYKPFLF